MKNLTMTITKLRLPLLWLFYALIWLTVSPGVYAQSSQLIASFDSCPLQNGTAITPCQIGYRTYGHLNADKSNAVLIPTWYGGTSAGHAYLATAEYIDPASYFIIIIDAIGNGVSSSPSNSISQPGAKFPAFSITDMVNTQHRLLTETLDINKVYATVGLSMGAMQTLQWAVQYPDFTTRYAAIIGTPRLPSFDIARWSTRNRLLQWYLACQCQQPLEIMVGLQMMGSVPAALSEDVPRDEVEAQIITQAQKIVLTEGEVFDQIRQAQAMINHNIAAAFDNDMHAAAAAIQGKLLVITGADDRVVTPEPIKQLASMTQSTLIELDKNCGHGDPWCDPTTFAKALKSFLAN